MVIDTTLDSLKIPALPTYKNEFGTKLKTGGVSTEAVTDNIAMTFRRQRPFEVIEDSITTDIESSCVFKITTAGITLSLTDATFDGCMVTIINTTDGDCYIIGGISGINGSMEKVTVSARTSNLFIFISGFLFQHLSGRYEFKNYLSKKWTNVIQPYLWTAIPGILFCFLFPVRYGNAFDGLNPVLQIPMMLSVGRVHNTPAWFIPMIILFFLSSWCLLKLEKKGWLYKLMPLMFLVTIFLPRVDVDYNSTLGLTYSAKYLAYLKYVFMGYIHFFSMYVFGMFCSANKDIIDKFWNIRWVFIILMLLAAGLNVYSGLNGTWTNGTLSKIFLTIIALAYLKHYDEWLISHEKLNKVLDIIAKYSFGIFFIHWYVFFLYWKEIFLSLKEFSGLRKYMEFRSFL